MARATREVFGEEWAREAEEALQFIEEPAARGQMLARFQQQYLPVIRAARTPESASRVWESFRYYITFPATWRKPFSLSDAEAERVIGALKALAE